MLLWCTLQPELITICYLNKVRGECWINVYIVPARKSRCPWHSEIVLLYIDHVYLYNIYIYIYIYIHIYGTVRRFFGSFRRFLANTKVAFADICKRF